MEEILVLSGENHTIKSLTELADKENRKVVIVGSSEDIVKHTETIKKFSKGTVGVVMVCLSQMALEDRNKIQQPKKDPLSNGSLGDLLMESIHKISREMAMLPEPISFDSKQELRKVKHPQAKPVRQFISHQKNHHFKRK